MEERADEAWVLWRRPGEPTLGQRIANEAAVAEFLSGVRQVLGMEVRPTAVHFRHAAPPTLREHETFFGVPVRFGQPDHAIGLPLSVLQKPPRLANEALASYFEARSIAEMQRARREQSLVERAESLTADQLLDGPPSSARLARQLGLAERTLRRKLGEAGTSHSAIVDAVRRERAEAMLRDPALTLADIAFALGFSAHAAFTRAYKRWTGRSPDSTRRLARDPAVPGG
jgi:AraC-like DNA-binding protein